MNTESDLSKIKLTAEDIDAAIVKEDYYQFPDTCFIVCALTLKNGFIVTGESSPISAANFDEEIGKSIAKAKAKDKIWALEGYRLKSEIQAAQG